MVELLRETVFATASACNVSSVATRIAHKPKGSLNSLEKGSMTDESAQVRVMRKGEGHARMQEI